MRRLIRLSVIVPGVMAGVAAGSLALWPIGTTEPAAFPAGDAGRVAYLARAGGCVSCRTDTAATGRALAGGAPLDTPFGTFVPPNVTPDPKAGIGTRTLRDLAWAVRQGISPAGDPNHPACTRSVYSGFTERDIADLWEAIRTVPPVAEAAPPHDVRFPFGFRPGPKLLAGSGSLPGGSKAPSILAPDLPARGRTVASLSEALKSGLLPGGDAFGGSMADVVSEGTSFLTEADREAMATRLFDPEGPRGTGTPTRPEAEAAMSGMDHSKMAMADED